MLQSQVSNENKFIADHKDNPKLYNTLTEATKVLFGVSFESLGKNFFPMVINTIIERFVGITLEDIKTAFKTHEIEKKAYVSLTRDEFLQPIKNYWEKKLKLVGEIASLKKKEQDEKKKEYFDAIDRVKAIKIYNDCLESGIDYTGSVYLCKEIAVDLAKYIEQKYKNKMWQLAQKDHKALKAKYEFNPMVYVPIAELIYCGYIVNFALEEKLKINELKINETNPF